MDEGRKEGGKIREMEKMRREKFGFEVLGLGFGSKFNTQHLTPNTINLFTPLRPLYSSGSACRSPGSLGISGVTAGFSIISLGSPS